MQAHNSEKLNLGYQIWSDLRFLNRHFSILRLDLHTNITDSWFEKFLLQSPHFGEA